LTPIYNMFQVFRLVWITLYKVQYEYNIFYIHIRYILVSGGVWF